jgi:invasion protein IalB
MESGLVARIAFLDGITGRQITVPVSLKGFSAAFRTLK